MSMILSPANLVFDMLAESSAPFGKLELKVLELFIGFDES
jgi:hypothetical protein